MQKLGVIDVGTNTFHLLIVEQCDEQGFKELYRERRFIKLAEEGIEKIGNGAFERGMQALIDYSAILERFEVRNFRAVGTAALRIASNGSNFMQQVFEKANISIELISGDEEARLIHLGVNLAKPFEGGKGMIMDIGGGSVEFIIADAEKVFWSQSFPVGIAILFKLFHQNDPISYKELAAANTYLKDILQPLILELPKYPRLNLIGASGAFEVVENILVNQKTEAVKSATVADFLGLHQKMLKCNLSERLQIEGLPKVRAELIVVAFLLIDFVVQHADIDEIIVCDYAMKEGVLFEMMELSQK